MALGLSSRIKQPSRLSEAGSAEMACGSCLGRLHDNLMERADEADVVLTVHARGAEAPS